MNNTLQRLYFTIDVVLPFASALVHGCGRDHPAFDTVDLEYFWGGYGLNRFSKGAIHQHRRGSPAGNS